MGSERNENKPRRQSALERNPLLFVALAIVLTSVCVWLAFYLGADPNVVHIAEIAVAMAMVAIAAWAGLRQRRISSDNGCSNGNESDEPASSSEQSPTDDDAALMHACETVSARFELSQREHDVLMLLAQGMTRQDIEETLVISMNTVKSHIRHIYQKLDIHSRDELMELLEQTRR